MQPAELWREPTKCRGQVETIQSSQPPLRLVWCSWKRSCCSVDPEYLWVSSFCPLKEISQLAPASGAVVLSPVPVGMVQELQGSLPCRMLCRAILCSPGNFPGRETQAWRVQHFAFGGGWEAALRVTAWQSCLPSVSCMTELSCFATCDHFIYWSFIYWL